jgi:hypothetical protein
MHLVWLDPSSKACSVEDMLEDTCLKRVGRNKWERHLWIGSRWCLDIAKRAARAPTSPRHAWAVLVTAVFEPNEAISGAAALEGWFVIALSEMTRHLSIV